MSNVILCPGKAIPTPPGLQFDFKGSHRIWGSWAIILFRFETMPQCKPSAPLLFSGALNTVPGYLKQTVGCGQNLKCWVLVCAAAQNRHHPFQSQETHMHTRTHTQKYLCVPGFVLSRCHLPVIFIIPIQEYSAPWTLHASSLL